MEPLSRLKPRPSEVCPELTVLYAKKPDGTPVLNPNDFSGVPRHPAYPSGHSTVAGASSAILKRFFLGSNDHAQLDDLADNAGLARMWAGIHYRADHEFGLALGAAVADLVYPAS
jgi:membrane-associated phospholipid phosphatase